MKTLVDHLRTLFLLLFWGSWGGLLFASTVQVSDKSTLVKEVKILADADESLSIETLLKAPETDWSSGKTSEYSDTNKAYWLSFTLENISDSPGEWVLDYLNWPWVEFYTIDSTGVVSKKLAGKRVPFLERDYPRVNYSLIKLRLEGGEKMRCFVKLKHMFNHEVKPNGLQFSITPRIQKDEQIYVIKQGVLFFSGIFLVMLLYNLFIYISTKESKYRYYLMILGLGEYFILHNSGFDQEIFGGFAWFDSVNYVIITIIAQVFGIAIFLFTRDFLNVPTQFPKWDKWIIRFIWGYVASAVIAFFSFEAGFVLSYLLANCVLVIVTTLGIKSWRSGNPSAPYFLIGYGLFFIGASITGFILLGFMPDDLYLRSFSMPAGSTLEIIFFAFALANTINVLRKDNTEKQERIIDQLRENEQLQTKVNRELESAVQARTQELELANQDLENFAHVVSHDLKAPLRGISGISDVLETEYKDKLDAEGHDYISLIKARVGKMVNLVDGILTYSKAGSHTANLETVNTELLVEDILDLLEVPAHIDIQHATPLPEVTYDQIQLSQVLQNLISNAIKYMDKPAGSIKIGATESAKEWELYVQDNGPGIPEEYVQKIFGAFETIKERETKDSTGIGLSTVKKIVEKHEGKVGVRSTEGGGSTFFFTIPK